MSKSTQTKRSATATRRRISWAEVVMAAAIVAILSLLIGLPVYNTHKQVTYVNSWPSTATPADRPAVDAAAASVLRVEACTTPTCGPGRVAREGSGWVVTAGRVITTALVVAQMRSVYVVDADQQTHAATVVVIDPKRDLAVLAVPTLYASALQQGGDLNYGDGVVIAGYPQGEDYLAAGNQVVGRAVLDDPTEEVLNGLEVYRLEGYGTPFLDGGPVLDGSGHVVGIAYHSMHFNRTTLALTLAAARPVLDAAAAASTPVSTGTL